MSAQKFAGGLKGILHRAIGAGECEHQAIDAFARGRQDDFHFAGSEELFGEAFDEPGREFSGASGGVAIGEFELKCLGHGANVFAAVHEVWKLEEIFPAITVAFAVDRDGGIRAGGEVKREVDSTAPGSGVGKFAIEELFDAFGGDREKVGVEDDKGGVGSEMGCGFGRSGAAGVVNEKLAGEAANAGGGLGESRE